LRLAWRSLVSVRVKFPLPAPGSPLTTCNTRSAQIGHRRARAEQSLVEPIGRRCATLMHVPQLQTPETLQPAYNSEDAKPSLPTIPLEVFLAAVNGQRSRTESKLCGAFRGICLCGNRPSRRQRLPPPRILFGQCSTGILAILA
jgi:hypothetical protein